MAIEFTIDNMRDGYIELVKRILNDGHDVSPRGMRTRELRDVTVVLRDPTDAIPLGVGRKLNLKIGAAETAQLIAGVSDAQMLINISPNFKQFADYRNRMRGAYGPRAREQFPAALKKLVEDNDTRQAVISIYRSDDLIVESADVPCTLALNFSIREGRLDAIVSMRSNDIVWGVPYDFWTFTMVQRALAYCLGIPVGTYTHHAFSMHAYIERDIDVFKRLHTPSEDYQGIPSPVDSGYTVSRATTPEIATTRWRRIRTRMEYAVGAKPTRKDASEEISAHYDNAQRWYADLLRPARSGLPFCIQCRYAVDPSEFNARWHVMCKTCRIANKYGFAPHEFDVILAEQDNCCPICDIDLIDEDDKVVDHDHDTGKVRGILHRQCNVALGMMGDDPATMTRAAKYVRLHRGAIDE